MKNWPQTKRLPDNYCTICKKVVSEICEDTDSCRYFDDWPEVGYQ